MVNLNLPRWIWICFGEFEFAVVNLNLPWWIWNLRRPTFVTNTFLFTANFKSFPQYFIVRSKIFNYLSNTPLQNFLPLGKTSSPRQNFLSCGKLLKARQIFLSGGKNFLPLQNFSCNLCTTSRGYVLERMMRGVRLFYKSYFFRSLPALGCIFQPFCKLNVPFQVLVLSRSQSFICLL